jgi:hypothetical protein
MNSQRPNRDRIFENSLKFERCYCSPIHINRLSRGVTEKAGVFHCRSKAAMKRQTQAFFPLGRVDIGQYLTCCHTQKALETSKGFLFGPQ